MKPRPPRPPFQPPRPPHGPTEIVHGLRAGLALLVRRPDDVRRVALASEVAREVEPALRVLRRRGVPIAVLAPRELERIAGAAQHEGLCVEALSRRFASPAELADRLASSRGTAIALDRVRNPYNVGAILRSAAFFGLDAALVGPSAQHAGLDPQAVRVAEGGAEHLLLCRTTDLAGTLARLRARGIRIVGADGHAETEAIGHRFARPTVLVLGNEREGLGPRVRDACDELVAIRGSGAVESLNVAMAAALLVSEMMRERR